MFTDVSWCLFKKSSKSQNQIFYTDSEFSVELVLLDQYQCDMRGFRGLSQKPRSSVLNTLHIFKGALLR